MLIVAPVQYLSKVSLTLTFDKHCILDVRYTRRDSVKQWPLYSTGQKHSSAVPTFWQAL